MDRPRSTWIRPNRGALDLCRVLRNAHLFPRRVARCMVLIVKLPARRPPKDFGSALPVQDDSVDTGQVRNLPDGIIRERASAEANTSELYRSSAHALSTSESITTEWVPVASKLDVLLAPSVLKHRYVRGVDLSLIHI